jgi:hypothetical protein
MTWSATKWFGTPQIVKVLHNKSSLCFFSFLIGFGLVVLILHRPTSSVKTLSIPVQDVEATSVQHDGKCYKFRAEDTKCEKVSIKE